MPVLYGISAYLVFRDKPGVFTAVLCTLGVLTMSGWMRGLQALPLAFSVIRIFTKHTGKYALGSAAVLLVISIQIFLWRIVPESLRPVAPLWDPPSLGWLAIVASLYLSIIVHEAGHALVGAAARFRLELFMVYPFFLRITNRRTDVRVDFRGALGGGYSGIPKHVRNLERRILWMIAGGPLGGILFATFCWFVLWMAEGRIGGFSYSLLDKLSETGLVLNLVNLLPLTAAGFKTDGRVLWESLFDRAAAESRVAAYGCSISTASSLRPRDWPHDWVEHLRENPEDLMAMVFLSASAEERWKLHPGDAEAREDLTLACDSLTRTLAQLRAGGADGHPLELQLAWLKNRYLGERIELDLAPLTQHRDIEPWEIFRLQATLAAAEGDVNRAATLVDQAEASLSTTVLDGIDAAALDGIRAFRQELLARV